MAYDALQSMWDKRYSLKEFNYGSTPNLYFRSRIRSLSPGKILLVCEGEGRNAVYAAYQGWKTVAMDYSEVGREKALKLAETKNVKLEYHLSPVETFEFPTAEFDAVGLIFAHFEPILRTYVHAQVRKTLKQDGRLIFEAFNKEQIDKFSGGPTDINMLYDLEDLKNDFAGFEFEECLKTQVILNEGICHVGKSEVIRIFGRKF
jgi:SAM-dependent methyltransferase